jgi:hypothetical protein
LIHAFQQYLIHQEQIGVPIGENWTSLTQDEFDAYRRSPAYVASQNGTTVAPPAIRSMISRKVLSEMFLPTQC